MKQAERGWAVFSSFAGSGAGAEVPKKFLKKDIVNPKSQRNVFDEKDGD